MFIDAKATRRLRRPSLQTSKKSDRFSSRSTSPFSSSVGGRNMCSWLRTFTRSPLAVTKVNGRPAWATVRISSSCCFIFCNVHRPLTEPGGPTPCPGLPDTKPRRKPGEPRHTQPCPVLGTPCPTLPGRDPAILIIIGLFFKRSVFSFLVVYPP